MANFIAVNGYELYTHTLPGHRGRGCGYCVLIEPVLALGIDEHGGVVSAITADLRVNDLTQLDFGQCYALKCPNGKLRFSTIRVMGQTASCWEKWIKVIRGTPEFTALRVVLHDLFKNRPEVAEQLLNEFTIKNEFCLNRAKYAEFSARANELESSYAAYHKEIHGH